MFALFCVAAGAGAGCGVCAFGMYAFLKGQRAAITVARGGLPEGLKSEKNRACGDGIPAQLAAMFGTEGEK